MTYPDEDIIPVARSLWYNHMLDPKAEPQVPKVRGGALDPPTPEHPANLVSSLCSDFRHRPALDIDVPMVVVPSSTPGHHHVYFPTLALDWEQYMELLHALSKAGIIQEGYRRASAARGQTLLRLPGVEKVGAFDYEGVDR